LAVLGFRILPASAPVPSEILQSFHGVPVAYVSDSMSRLCGTVGLEKVNRAGYLAGTALTVKTNPGDNLMIHKALDLARPGDVLVVDGGGFLGRALVGELMMTYAKTRGVVGFVIDGAIRDVAAFREGDFPCYARGFTHRGPYKEGPGEINVPVAVGGLVIAPGDIVLGDDDGVVAFSREEAAELLGAVRSKAQAEESSRAAIAEGRYDRRWVDETLRKKGVDVSMTGAKG